MTKAELIKELRKYKDSDEVYITLIGARTIYEIECISDHNGCPVLESDEAPDFSDLKGMAQAHYEEYGQKIEVIQDEGNMAW